MATRLTAPTRLPDGGRYLVRSPWLWDFDAPLKTSLAPLAWTGAVTFTRAFVANVADNEWVLRRANSGEARFEWARRVENMVTYSQDLTNAIWTKSNTTIGAYTDTVDWLPTFTLTDDATNASHSVRYNLAHSINRMYCVSAYVKAGTASACQIAVASVSTEYANFDLSNGTITAGNTSQATMVSKGNGWYRISLYYTAILTSAQLAGVFMITSPTSARAQQYAGSGSTIRVAWFQIENITGQSILAPAEYVSTNVLTTFPYHGAGVDWVKYFDTTLAGAKIPESTLKWFLNEWQRINLLLENTWLVTSWSLSGATRTSSAIVCPNGALSGIKLIPDAWTQSSQVFQTVTVSATTYAYSIYAKAWEFWVVQLRTDWAISSGFVNFDLVNGVVGTSSVWTGSMEALPNGWYRCIAITDTVVATTNNIVAQIVPSLSSLANDSVTWDWVGGVYLYGAQWEAGTFASSLIITAGASLTRLTDYLTYNVANTLSSQWSVSCDFTLRYVPTTGIDRRAIGLSGNTNSRFAIRATDTSWISNRSWILIWDGASVLTIYNSFSCSANTTYKVSSSWLNGSTATFNASWTNLGTVGPVSVTTTQVDIGSVWSGASNLHGNIKNVKIWKTVLDSDTLRLLTI